MTIILVIKQLQNDKKLVSLNRFIIHTVKLCLNSIEYANSDFHSSWVF